MQGEFQRNLQHILAEEGHPGRSIRFFQVTSRGKGCATVEDTDIVQAQKAAIEYIATVAVLAVDPPGKIEHQLLKSLFQKLQITLPSMQLFDIVNMPGCPGVHRWIDITEVPFIGWELTGGMQIKLAQYQAYLFLGIVQIDHRQRDGMKSQVPCRKPRVFPFIRHRNDIATE